MIRNTAYIFFIISALCLSGCSTIYEYPTEPPSCRSVEVEMTFVIDPLLEPFEWSRTSTGMDMGDYSVRWIVEISNDAGVVYRNTTTTPLSMDGLHSTSLVRTLEAAKYKITVWCDYVDMDCDTDKYYCTDDFSCIKIADMYEGSIDWKDAFSVTEDLDLTNSAVQDAGCMIQKEFTLTRPMAKIEIISTDLDKFMDKMESEMLSQKPEDLRICFTYDGYFPSGINLYTNKPNEARTGICFDTSPEIHSESEACLGCDYIFVNGSKSSVSVHIDVMDSDGRILHQIAGISVPIVRGQLTTIKDNFLTASYSPGIGIDPGFNGDINITMPD